MIGRNTFFKLLREHKILQSSKSDWNIPYQSYVRDGYFKVLFKTIKNGVTIATTRITPKGLDFLHELIIILGYSYEGTMREIETFVSNDEELDEEDLDIYK